jgi:hypothetical protein
MSTDKRIINLPLITSGNVVNTIVLPLDDPNDGVTKKITLSQIKTFVLSGNTYTTNFTPSSSGDTSGVVGQITYDNNFLYVKTGLGWGRLGLGYGF